MLKNYELCTGFIQQIEEDIIYKQENDKLVGNASTVSHGDGNGLHGINNVDISNKTPHMDSLNSLIDNTSSNSSLCTVAATISVHDNSSSILSVPDRDVAQGTDKGKQISGHASKVKSTSNTSKISTAVATVEKNTSTTTATSSQFNTPPNKRGHINDGANEINNKKGTGGVTTSAITVNTKPTVLNNSKVSTIKHSPNSTADTGTITGTVTAAKHGTVTSKVLKNKVNKTANGNAVINNVSKHHSNVKKQVIGELEAHNTEEEDWIDCSGMNSGAAGSLVELWDRYRLLDDE